jgi:hypothetical protein
MAEAQVPTVSVRPETIMRRAAFREGFEDARAGRRPRFDFFQDDDEWSYERGRLFARIAPETMPLLIDGKLNRKAVKLFALASERRLIP